MSPVDSAVVLEEAAEGEHSVLLPVVRVPSALFHLEAARVHRVYDRVRAPIAAAHVLARTRNGHFRSMGSHNKDPGIRRRRDSYLPPSRRSRRRLAPRRKCKPGRKEK